MYAMVRSGRGIAEAVSVTGKRRLHGTSRGGESTWCGEYCTWQTTRVVCLALLLRAWRSARAGSVYRRRRRNGVIVDVITSIGLASGAYAQTDSGLRGSARLAWRRHHRERMGERIYTSFSRRAGRDRRHRSTAVRRGPCAGERRRQAYSWRLAPAAGQRSMRRR